MWLNRDLPNYYDDIITFNSFALSELWKSSNINQIYNANLDGRVGIGTSTPVERLHVAGNAGNPGTIMTDETRSNQICTKDNICFNPETLSGTDPCMKCPKINCPGVPNDPVPNANHASLMVGIARNRAYCSIADLPRADLFKNQLCPLGQLMSGVRFVMSATPPRGELVCYTPGTTP
jgi:hypothetical protein